MWFGQNPGVYNSGIFCAVNGFQGLKQYKTKKKHTILQKNHTINKRWFTKGDNDTVNSRNMVKKGENAPKINNLWLQKKKKGGILFLA